MGHGAVKIRKDRTKCKANTGEPKQKVALTGAITLLSKLKIKRGNVQGSLKSARRTALWTSKYRTGSCDANHKA